MSCIARKPNEFQKELMSVAVCFAVQNRFEVSVFGEGERELYLLCSIKGVKVYIYEDAFDFQSSGIDVRYEKGDLISVPDVASLFLETLETSIEQAMR